MNLKAFYHQPINWFFPVAIFLLPTEKK